MYRAGLVETTKLIVSPLHVDWMAAALAVSE
jgi:hypothetical protein